MSSRQFSHRLLIVISIKWIIVSHQLLLFSFFLSRESVFAVHRALWAVIYWWTKELKEVLYSNIRSVLFDIMLISTAAGWRMLLWLCLFSVVVFSSIKSILLNTIVDIEQHDSTIQYYYVHLPCIHRWWIAHIFHFSANRNKALQ